MAKLTRRQSQNHNKCLEYLKKDKLVSLDEIEFILEHYQESANQMSGLLGAFFTPIEYAAEFISLASPAGRVLDLCAGIGGLSWHVSQRAKWQNEKTEITCVEINQDYIDVGKKIVPDARWIQGNVIDVCQELYDQGERFDIVISNPPFGNISSIGSNAEFKVIESASKLAKLGYFILPQMSCPFKYTGQKNYEKQDSDKYNSFHDKTGLEIELLSSLDTSEYTKLWKGTNIVTEICVVDF